MRFSEGELPILSAELYGDDRVFPAPKRLPAVRKKQVRSSSRGIEEGPRKRKKTQPVETPDQDDETKRARGRPRLDTKDETAADTLEKKVQSLRDTNEEMSNVFMQLHDFALSSGLLDQVPEFGRQLQQTTEKFLSLAREASDEDLKEGEAKTTISTPVDKKGGDSQSATSSPSPPVTTHPAGAAASPESSAHGVPTTLPSGIMVPYTSGAQPNYAVAPTLPQQDPPTTTFPYEILTHPTLDNASFPLEPFPNLPFSDNLSFSALLPPSPAPPASYADLETTFGRRLHRYSLEQALILLDMPNPPESLIARVFGFCLLIESPATIHRRLLRMLGRGQNQSLFNWQFPFYHLGGAGTHFELDLDSDSAPNTSSTGANTPGVPTHPLAGNQGREDVLKPASTSGFATGPFSAAINSVRDRQLDIDMRMALPGFAGEYFDCDEAEMYLYRRGVVIPPGSEVVTIEVDVNELEAACIEGEARARSSDNSGGAKNAGGGVTEWKAETIGDLDTGSSGSETAWSIPGGTAAGGGMVDPALDVFGSEGDPFMPATSMAGGSGILPFGMVATDVMGNIGYQEPRREARNPALKRVVVDVMQLVKEMAKRGICLGRTPGFKQSDVDRALWRAIKTSTE
ncbi:uncharacterized protein C8A04DRAFT_9014 [Dichotomopilus funicola]|uniref:Uncharacterized protein n=1 Tax=Dichotomopilus funicola TaxID=1934379 RepID=A0AAN6VB92_9PEZI|nr:hypothetical protein C8A04DRAFT_9014 [Dichotomopilus funicola]